jgi:hypothetical protein
MTSTFAGQTDWRLPTEDELVSLVDYSRIYSAINGTLFPNTTPTFYWSASAVSGYSDIAWGVNFGYGDAGNGLKYGYGFQARLVRSGQSAGVFANNRSTYSITKTSTGFSIRDNVGNGGTVPLSGATQIRFADMTVNLLIGDLSKTLAASDLKTLVELYVAFFDRVPDADGLAYWINQFKGGMTMDQIANNFYVAAVQYSSLTGYSASMSDADFVRIIYDNVLGRTGPTAPSDADVHYWSDQITNGTVSRGRLITIILGAAHGYKGDATWGWVADLLDNKFSVANYFCVQQGLNYNTPRDTIRYGMAIAAAVTRTSTAAALATIGVADEGFDLTAP